MVQGNPAPFYLLAPIVSSSLVHTSGCFITKPKTLSCTRYYERFLQNPEPGTLNYKLLIPYPFRRVVAQAHFFVLFIFGV